MLDISRYQTDLNKEVEGIWVPIQGGARLLLARAGNDRWNRLYNALPRTVRQELDDGMTTDDENLHHIAHILSETVLLGWEGLTENGEPVSYSKEKAYEWMKRKDLKDFTMTVLRLAQERQLFAAKQDEEDSKNLLNSSDGS